MLGKAVNLGEAQPRAEANLLCREKGLESARQHFLCHAGAGVRQSYGNELTRESIARVIAGSQGGVPRIDTELAPPRHGIARVHADIEQRQFEFGAIDHHRPDILRHFDNHFDILGQRAR